MSGSFKQRYSFRCWIVTFLFNSVYDTLWRNLRCSVCFHNHIFSCIISCVLKRGSQACIPLLSTSLLWRQEEGIRWISDQVPTNSVPVCSLSQHALAPQLLAKWHNVWETHRKCPGKVGGVITKMGWSLSFLSPPPQSSVLYWLL